MVGFLGWFNGPPPLDEIVTIYRKVCDALSFAHSRGILHRDIKPDNIMLGDYGEVMLVDWGAASGSASGDPKAARRE